MLYSKSFDLAAARKQAGKEPVFSVHHVFFRYTYPEKISHAENNRAMNNDQQAYYERYYKPAPELTTYLNAAKSPQNR